MTAPVTWAVTLLAAGLLVAVAYAASPLSVCVLLVAPVVARALGRNLPADERRVFYGVFAAAFAARVAIRRRAVYYRNAGSERSQHRGPRRR